MYVAMHQIGMDTGNAFRQFLLSGFCFWSMDNHMDWSAFSADTTHLPIVQSMRERLPAIPNVFLERVGPLLWIQFIKNLTDLH